MDVNCDYMSCPNPRLRHCGSRKKFRLNYCARSPSIAVNFRGTIVVLSDAYQKSYEHKHPYEDSEEGQKKWFTVQNVAP
jgi:hypothetical protein